MTEVALDTLKAEFKSAFSMGPFGSKIKAENFKNVGVPVIKGGNLGGTYLDESKFDFLTQEKADELSASKARRLDIVITHRGSLGQVGLIPPTSKFREYVVSQSQLKLSFDVTRVDPYFVYYFLRSPLGQSRLLANSSQVGVPAIAQALTTIRQLKIPLPSLREQQEITTTLRSLDERIALLHETNATLESIAQALFKSWFIDFSPVREKQGQHLPEGKGSAVLFPDSFEDSELGLVPRGWRRSTLGAICVAHGGGIQTGPFGSQLHASDYLAEGIPVVMPQDIQTRRVKVDKIARISESDANRLSRHQLQPGDIVFSRRGDVGRHALVGEREAGWLCGTGCLLVRPGAAWPSPTYLSLALDRTEAKDWLLRHAVGATMPNLNTGILSDVPIMWPETSVLAAFDNYVRVLDERVSHGHACIRSLTKIRDSLLPRLISGQLQLPDAEQFTAALKAA